MGNFLKDRLIKTRESLFGRIKNLITGRSISKDLYQEIEEILITSDISVKTANSILQSTFDSLKDGGKEEFIEAIKKQMLSLFSGDNLQVEEPLNVKPLVVMVIGVNGVGKTTTIGKIARIWKEEGKNGILAACDTFRAAAIEQLEILSERIGLRVVKQKIQSDPASVAFDSLRAAIAGGYDFLILDTAGRLHTKYNLMEELKKIKRVLAKENKIYPQEILLVLDATFGQNTLAQVKEFNDALGISGIVMTKMDGTAKGGTILTLTSEYSIPIKYIGIGEGEDDLIPFKAKDFVNAIFS